MVRTGPPHSRVRQGDNVVEVRCGMSESPSYALLLQHHSEHTLIHARRVLFTAIDRSTFDLEAAKAKFQALLESGRPQQRRLAEASREIRFRLASSK